MEPTRSQRILVVDVDVDVRLDAEPEWATVSVATRAPKPTAADVAAIPMAAVIRRTRTMARSLASSAGWRSWRGCSGGYTMA